MKKYIPFSLIMAIVIAMFLPYQILAKTNSPLVDVKQTDWFYKDVYEAYARQLIQGKENNGVLSFKPHDSVTKPEALAMVIRYLGHEQTALGYSSSQIDQQIQEYGINQNNITAWERPYIAYALRHNYVTKDGWTGSATRLWISDLLVRVLDRVDQAEGSRRSKVTGFNDDALIPITQKGYVNTVVELGLLTGESRNGHLYFNPNGTTTRAQMASILIRLDNHSDVANNYSETVVVKEFHPASQQLTFQDKAGKIQTISYDNTIFFVGNYIRGIHELDIFDEVRIAVRNDRIVFVDWLGKSSIDEDIRYATFDELDMNIQMIWLYENGKRVAYTYYAPLLVVDEQNRSISLEKLKQGTTIKHYTDQTKTIERVVLVSNTTNIGYEREVIQANFHSFDENLKIINVENKNGRIQSFSYNDWVKLTYKEVELPNLSQLQRGDQLQLVIKDGVESIKILQLVQPNGVLTGGFLAVDPMHEFIVYRTGGQNKIAVLSPESTVTLGASHNLNYDDLLRGDGLTIYLEDGIASKIVVGNRGRVEQIRGAYGDYIPVDQVIKYWTENGAFLEHKIANDLRVVINGREGKLTDLYEKTPITIFIENNLIYQIIACPQRQGIFKELNDEITQLTLLTGDSSEKVYTLFTQPEIEWTPITNKKKISDFREGDELRYTLNRSGYLEKIYEVKNGKYFVQNASTLGKYLLVEDQKQLFAFYVTDTTKFIIPDIKYPTLEDFIGKSATFTFIGKDLVQVEVK